MKFLPILMLAALTACESNPYKGMTLSAEPAPDRLAVRPAMGVSANDVLSYPEGMESGHTVTVKVPDGTPVVSWENLPAGATYDLAESKLKWRPAFDAANDPNDPTVKSRDYQVVLNLQSSLDPVTVVQKTILLRVTDSPRALGVTGLQPSYEVAEGTAITLSTFATDSLDFPAAALRLSLKNSSPGLSLVRDASGKWVLKAAFGLDTIQVGRNCCILRLNEAVVIVAPDGRQVEVPLAVAVRDVRQNVTLPVPRNLMVDNELRMAFTLSDPNMEIAPKIEVRTTPTVGSFAITQVRDAGKANAPAFESYFELAWTQIPAEAVGQTFSAVITTCNARQGNGDPNHNNCTNHQLNLTVQAREVPMPTIARGDWSAVALKYLRLDRPYSTTFTVRAGGNARMLATTATSSDADDKVEFDGLTGALKLTGKKPGLKLLTIAATNSMGGRGSETFLYEVLAANWFNRIIVGTAAGQAEFAGVETLFGGANREYRAGQSLDARNLAFRDTVWAGTQSLQLPDGALDLAFYAANVKTVVISTPMLDKLPASMVAELRALGVRVGARTSAIPNFNLADFEVTPSRRMGAPAGVTKLAGITTSESANLGVVNLVNEDACEKLLSIFKDGPMPEQYSVGVSCKRANGGMLVVLGFEWSDLRFAEGDADFNAKWFQRMRE